MNKLFLYIVGTGVLILFMVVGWEVLQIVSGIKSLVNQSVIEMPRDKIFVDEMDSFLREKSLERSGLVN